MNIGRFNWDKCFSVDFDMERGFSNNADTTKRKLSQMKDMYCDTAAVNKILEEDDPLVYEFYEMGTPERFGELAFGTTILYPGMVGNEYYMTKGHFHTILETSEVYYTLKGEGYMLLENPEGDTHLEKLIPGNVCYVPRRYAHRMINTGDTPLVTFFVFEAIAGHDYGTIETKGYRKLVVNKDGVPVVKDNPKWE